MGSLLGGLGQLVTTSERPSYDGCREPGQWLASPSLRDRVDRPVAWGLDLCLVVLFERSVGRLVTLALDTTAGAIANRVRMSTVRALHCLFSKSWRFVHLSKRRNCTNPASFMLFMISLLFVLRTQIEN